MIGNMIEHIFIFNNSLSEFKNFQGILESIENESAVWEDYINLPEIQKFPLPLLWDTKLTDFQKLLLIKCVRPDKVSPAVWLFVKSKH